MKLQGLFSALSILGLTTATPLPSIFTRTINSRRETCLQQNVATEIVNQFVSLLTAFNPTVATSLLSASSFTDTSDSINFLGGYPLGAPTFQSQQAFIAGQGTQPAIGMNVTSIDAVSCEGVIAFRWVGSMGPNTQPVKGINVLYTSNCDTMGGGKGKGVGGWVITQVFSEFNSGAWTNNIGGSCKPPTFGAPPS